MRRSRSALVLIFLPLGVHAACTVNVTGVAFGMYDPFASSDSLSTGTLDVRCSPAATYTLKLSGGAGSFTSRKMTNGPSQLLYNLYTDASRVTIWGDGTAGTSTVQDHSNKKTYTVYGRVPARQNPKVGAHSDTLVVTVEF
jgi:spore coat protein U-like protein